MFMELAASKKWVKGPTCDSIMWSVLVATYICHVERICDFTSGKTVSFGADLAKIKHFNTMICYLIAKTNRMGQIANGTKL